MLIFIDESGDLGFDFTKPATSKYFIVTLLVLSHYLEIKPFEKAVERTIKNKIKKKKKLKIHNLELKGAKTSLNVKKYFYKHLSSANFEIFAIILNKKRVYESLKNRKPRLYNFITKQILEKCRFNKAKCAIEIIIDKSKGPREQKDFNNYLTTQLQAQLPSNIPLRIYHNRSHENKLLQAADLFCWGIARKWESDNNDLNWYNSYKNKIKMEDIYLPPFEP